MKKKSMMLKTLSAAPKSANRSGNVMKDAEEEILPRL